MNNLKNANPAQNPIARYYSAIGFSEGETFILRVEQEGNQSIYVGTIESDSVDGFTLHRAKKEGVCQKSSVNIYTPGTPIHKPWDFLRKLGEKGSQVFSYPNLTGRSLGKQFAKSPTCLFYEIDDRTIKDQSQIIESLVSHGIHPAAIVFSGNKSLHVYIRLMSPISVQDWERINRKLTIVAEGDWASCAIAHGMRLPGVPRRNTNGEIKEQSLDWVGEAVYDPQDIEHRLDSTGLFPHGLSDTRWRKWCNSTESDRNPLALALPESLLAGESVHTQSTTTESTPLWARVPLSECLTRDDRDLLKSGAGHNTRNVNGYKLARNIIATQRYLDSLRCDITEDPFVLFEEYCDRCDPPISESERSQIWRSAQRGNPTPSRTEEQIHRTIRFNQGETLPKRKKSQSRRFTRLNEVRAWITSLGGVLPPRITSVHELAKALSKQMRISQKSIRNEINGFRQSHLIQSQRSHIVEQQSPRRAIVGNYSPLPMPSQRQLIVLDGQKGTGKTEIAIASLIEEAKKRSMRVLIVTPSRFLSQDLANRLTRFVSHVNLQEALRSPYVVTCPESAHKFSLQAWDLVVFDEPNESCPRLWGGTLSKDPAIANEGLDAIVRSSYVTVLAQDNILPPIIRAVQRIGCFQADETVVIRRTRQFTHMNVELYRSRSRESSSAFLSWLQKLITKSKAGEKISLPCGSQAKARELSRLLKILLPEKKISIVDGQDSFESLKQDIAGNFDAWIQREEPDIFIWTPLFNSGVSSKSNYFDAQFEYVAAFEPSSLASQRGERIRTAIGGGKIKTRYVFIQEHGLPAVMPTEMKSIKYWRGIAENEQYPELAECLQAEAVEVHNKAEKLQLEWKFNGWTVQPGEILDRKEVEYLEEILISVREDIILSRSRIYAKAPSSFQANHSKARWGKLQGKLSRFKAGSAPRGPIEKAQQLKWKIEDLLGNTPFLSDPNWWAAFYVDGKESITAAKLLGLFLLDSETWKVLAEWRSLHNQSAIATDFIDVPPFPLSEKEFEWAGLLRQCPHLRKVVTGQISSWSVQMEEVKAIRRWSINNAQSLSKASQCSQRWWGYQFTEKTPAVQCLNKLLAMLGLKATQEKGVRVSKALFVRYYRLKDASDFVQQLDAIAQKADSTNRNQGRVERKLYRGQHWHEVVSLYVEQLETKINHFKSVRSAFQQEDPSTDNPILTNLNTSFVDAITQVELAPSHLVLCRQEFHPTNQ